jgi:UDP-GlcNAc3NAcA epimerase
MLISYRLLNRFQGIKFVQPVGFLDMIALESNAKLIATDSGGVQKEAYFHRVPCVTLRTETEWVETVEANWNKLAGVDSSERISQVIKESLSFAGQRTEILDYGDGAAAQKIVQRLNEFLPG